MQKYFAILLFLFAIALSVRSQQYIVTLNVDSLKEILPAAKDTLTNRPQDDRWPTWSPDGSKIAFQTNLGGTELTEVFTMNADGTGITRLTTANGLDQMPTWSPDGMKIAFMSTRDGNPEIFVMNQNGSSQFNITNNPAADGRPSWSREGDWITFMSTRNGNQEIYLMNGEGSNPTRLTNNTVVDDFPFIK